MNSSPHPLLYFMYGNTYYCRHILDIINNKGKVIAVDTITLAGVPYESNFLTIL
jgi:hypothetical protein